MTDQHRGFGLDLDDPALLRLPDDDSPVVYLTARMAITDGNKTLCEWSEQDVKSAIDDLAHKTTVLLGEHAYLDVFYFGDLRVQLLIWTDGHAHPRHVVEVSEGDFFAEIDRISAVADAWS